MGEWTPLKRKMFGMKTRTTPTLTTSILIDRMLQVCCRCSLLCMDLRMIRSPLTLVVSFASRVSNKDHHKLLVQHFTSKAESTQRTAKHFASESKTICRRHGVSNRGSRGYVQTSATVGLACAQATAMRTHVAPHNPAPLRSSSPVRV